MPFPLTLAALEEAGYKRSNYSRCKGCLDSIEWWITPNGENMPMEPMPRQESAAISHWALCGQAQRFRRKKPQPCKTVASNSPVRSD